ncbi:hypothetical protein GCM10027447_35240 [Glycomyces halotolerans]
MGFWNDLIEAIDDIRGPYDIHRVPTRTEIEAFIDTFEPAVRHAMLREAAKERYPDYGDFIDMSADEWERAKDSTGEYRELPNADGGFDHVRIAKWHDQLELVLPTAEGLNYFEFYSWKRRGPDPELVVDGILADGETQTVNLMSDLRDACAEALGSADLNRLRHTAEQHADLYVALDAAVDELAGAIAKVEAMAADWEGEDADRFKEQYANAIGPALDRHSAIALNLRRAADSDLGIQVGLTPRDRRVAQPGQGTDQAVVH